MFTYFHHILQSLTYLLLEALMSFSCVGGKTFNFSASPNEKKVYENKRLKSH